MADGAKTLAGLVLTGGALYFLWRTMRPVTLVSDGAAPLDRGNDSPPGPSGGSLTPGRAVSEPDLSDSVARRIRSMAGDGEYTADEWGWYYAQVTGRPAPPPEDYGFVGDNRFRRVGFDEWWNAIRKRIAGSSAAVDSSVAEGALSGIWEV